MNIENFKKKDKTFGRDFNNSIRYKIWVKYGGTCCFCGHDLFFIDNLNKEHLKNNGKIAHIISANSEIRSSTKEFPYVNNLFLNVFGDKEIFNKTNIELPYGYISKLVSHEENLVLLCSDCHELFDNPQKNRNIKNNELNSHIINSKTEKLNDNDYKYIYEFTKNKIEDKKSLEILEKPFIAFSENNKSNLSIIMDFIKSLCINKKAFFVIDLKIDVNNDFYKIYKEIYKEINTKEINDELLTQLKTKLEEILKLNYLIKFSSIKESDDWLISFVKKDYYNIESQIKNKETLRKKISSYKKNNTFLEHNIFSENFSNPNEIFREKPEYKIIKNILVNHLSIYSNSKSDYFNSFSISYFARWGTGKTSIIRTITKDLSDYYNYVEINLWNISNSFNSEINNIGSIDNSFVRQIVKESITQLINNPDYVKMYIDSEKRYSSNENCISLQNEMINSLIEVDVKNSVNIIEHRSKFIDQFLTNLQNAITTIFFITQKPTIFIFDDIDRISDSKKIVEILDSIVTFLNLKNCVYIFPVDESKIIKAVSEIRPNFDSYHYINKYFNYSVKSSFIPKMDNVALIKEQIESIDNIKKIPNSIIKIIGEIVDPFHRSIKDFLNILSFNFFSFKQIIEKNNFIKKFINTKKINIDLKSPDDLIFFMSSLSSIIQIKYPLIIDFISKNINNLRYLISFIKDKLKKILENNFILHIEQNLKKSINREEEQINKEMINSIIMTESYISIEENNDWKIFIKKKHESSLENSIIKLKSILEIFNLFQVSDFNNDLILILWLSLTLSDVKNKYFLEYLRLSIVEEKIKIENDMLSFLSENNNVLILVEYLEKMKSFEENNLYKKDQKNYFLVNFLKKSIIELISKSEQKNNVFNQENIIKIYLLLLFDSNNVKKYEMDINHQSLFINYFNVENFLKEKEIKLEEENLIQLLCNLNKEGIERLSNCLDKLNIEIKKDNELLIVKNEYISIELFLHLINIFKDRIIFENLPIIDNNYENLLRNYEKLDWAKINIEQFIFNSLNFDDEFLIKVIKNIKNINVLFKIISKIYENREKIWNNGIFSNYFSKYMDIINTFCDDYFSSEEYSNAFLYQECSEAFSEETQKSINTYNILFEMTFYFLSLELKNKNNTNIDYINKFFKNYFFNLRGLVLNDKWNKILNSIANDFYLKIELNRNLLSIVDIDIENVFKNVISVSFFGFLIFNVIENFNKNLDSDKFFTFLKNFDEKSQSSIYREKMLKKINYFHKTLAFEKMLFYEGVTFNDIIEYKIQYNDLVNNIEYKKAFQEYFDKNKSMLNFQNSEDDIEIIDDTRKEIIKNLIQKIFDKNNYDLCFFTIRDNRRNAETELIQIFDSWKLEVFFNKILVPNDDIVKKIYQNEKGKVEKNIEWLKFFCNYNDVNYYQLILLDFKKEYKVKFEEIENKKSIINNWFGTNESFSNSIEIEKRLLEISNDKNKYKEYFNKTDFNLDNLKSKFYYEKFKNEKTKKILEEIENLENEIKDKSDKLCKKNKKIFVKKNKIIKENKKYLDLQNLKSEMEIILKEINK